MSMLDGGLLCENDAEPSPPRPRYPIPAIDKTPIALTGVERDRLVAIARTIFHARRRRDAIFTNLNVNFGEPAWDILLDLFIADSEGRKVPVSSVCYAAGVPATTGLRCIQQLVQRGIVVREADRYDGRRINVRLTPASITAVEIYLAGEFAASESRRPEISRGVS